jgi:hypothetical protein
MRIIRGLFAVLILLVGCKTELPGVPPERPTLLLPADQTPCEVGLVVNNQAMVAFAWEAVEEALYYNLEIQNLTTEEMIPVPSVEDTSTEVPLDRGHYYQWSVTAENAIYKAKSAETYVFYLSEAAFENTAPAPPVAIYPQQGQTISPELSTIRLQWSSYDADLDELVFELTYDTSEGLDTNAILVEDLTEPQYELTLAPSTEYFWRIKVFDGQSRTYSQVFSFRTAPN